MSTPQHSPLHMGHAFHALGLFILIMVATVLMPLNTGLTRAFGTSDIVELSNQARQQLGQPPLSSNTQLTSAAQAKAEDMAKKRYFQHIAPDGTTPWYFFEQSGYSYSLAGENLAITNESADAVIEGWLNSPTHRENLLNSQYGDMGIGVANFGAYQGHKDVVVVVAFYGSRTGAQNPTALTTPAGTTAALKPRILDVPPSVLIAVAGVLILVGVLLEIRHIRRLHHLHSQAS